MMLIVDEHRWARAGVARARARRAGETVRAWKALPPSQARAVRTTARSGMGYGRLPILPRGPLPFLQTVLSTSNESIACVVLWCDAIVCCLCECARRVETRGPTCCRGLRCAPVATHLFVS